MKRVYYASASDTPPSPPKVPITDKYPQDGNKSTKTMPTVIGAFWYHMITEEFMAVIEQAGLEPSLTNLHQLADVFADFRTRASAAEGFANQAKSSAESAAASATGVVTETAEKIKEIDNEGDKQVAAIQSAGSTVSSDVAAGKASLQTKLEELIAQLESVGGTEAASVKQQAQDILDAISLSESHAKASETNAKASADSAAQSLSASQAIQEDVTTKQSAVNATKASIDSTAAQVASDADDAASSQSAAATSAKNAATSESNAKASASAASNSASAAKASQTAAATSESNAAASAVAASDSADAAQSSSASAASSKNAASASAATATSQASAAKDSATAASSSASSASASAKAASDSASAASSSASSAATSEKNASASASAAAASQSAVSADKTQIESDIASATATISEGKQAITDLQATSVSAVKAQEAASIQAIEVGSVLAGYAKATDVAATYLPLTGGTMSLGQEAGIKFKGQAQICSYIDGAVCIRNLKDTTTPKIYMDNLGVGGGTLSYTNPGDYFAFSAAVKAPSFQATSDARKKTGLTPVHPDLSGLTAYRYTLKDDGKTHVGLVAQEVEKVIPEAVSEDKEGFLALDYNAVVAALVDEVNRLRERVEALEAAE